MPNSKCLSYFHFLLIKKLHNEISMLILVTFEICATLVKVSRFVEYRISSESVRFNWRLLQLLLWFLPRLVFLQTHLIVLIYILKWSNINVVWIFMYFCQLTTIFYWQNRRVMRFVKRSWDIIGMWFMRNFYGCKIIWPLRIFFICLCF